jgi:hypothetical protein
MRKLFSFFFILALVISVNAQASDSYVCHPSSSYKQCLADDEDCRLWGQVRIDDVVPGKKFAATFYSKGDLECENCEGAGYSFKSGNIYNSEKTKFNLFTGLTPKITIIGKTNEVVSKLLLSTEAGAGKVYMHLYNCRLDK